MTYTALMPRKTLPKQITVMQIPRTDDESNLRAIFTITQILH